MDHSAKRVYAPEHTLLWALLLLRAMHKSGMTHSDNRRFHRLVYFANTLARLYEFQPPAEVVMRLPRGPFYPQAQRDLDRLCVMGLADVRNYELLRHDDAVERRGCYDISSAGFRVCEEVAGSGWVRAAGKFLFDVCLAYANIDRDFKAEDEDFNYQRPSTEPAPVFTFRTAQQNLSVRVTDQLRDSRPEVLRPIPQHALRVYLRYLQRLAA
jgi:hypothetical protein